MKAELVKNLAETANHARYAAEGKGFYESYFIRANHPDKPVAFWIRYTVFEPSGDLASAMGELWATWFDGSTAKHVSVKDEFPVSKCVFDKERFFVKVGDALLDKDKAAGRAGKENSVSWDLSYAGISGPLFLFSPGLYETKLPKAKSLVGLPLARFDGTIAVDGNTHEINGWIGSQNHNWGVKHTDHYAWGQVAGFDGEMDSFFEVATAQLKFGPVKTPRMTLMVLRHRGREYALNTILRSLLARGRFGYFSWEFASENDEVSIQGTIVAQKDDFVGLEYRNPPGGIKHCLNTKIASCRLSVLLKSSGERIELATNSRAAFEILTDDHHGHGIKIHA